MLNMKVMMIRTKPLIKEYLDGIKAYLKDITNNLKISYTWKIQLAVAINFISSKNIVEERVIYSKRDNIEMMNYEKVDKVIQNIFESLLFRYQADLVVLFFHLKSFFRFDGLVVIPNISLLTGLN